MKFDSFIWVGWGRDILRTRIPDKFLKILFPNVKKLPTTVEVDKLPKIHFPAFMGLILKDYGNKDRCIISTKINK